MSARRSVCRAVCGALSALLGLLLAACGGGGAVQGERVPPVGPVTVEFFGDSLTWGAVDMGSNITSRLPVPPVRRAQELLGPDWYCVDMSLPGAIAAEVLAGTAFLPAGPFAAHVRASPASVVVLRLGGADAIRGTPVADFERDLTELVRLAQAAGQRVLLVGVIRLHLWRDLTDAHLAAVDAMDAAVRRVATATGAGFADVRSVPVTFPDDLADTVHPGQAWSDRMVAVIVDQIRFFA